MLITLLEKLCLCNEPKHKEDNLIIKEKNGFTLIEVIVVAGIIAILASILVPMILKEIDEARITKATADVRSIFTALVVFKKDTAQWPVMDDACDANVTLLAGTGNQPQNLAAMGYDTSVTSPFDDHLVEDANGCYNNWKGPYIATVSADPWGNQYYINAKQLQFTTEPVWIISAGPNGSLDTPASSQTIFGDDVGFLIQYGTAPVF